MRRLREYLSHLPSTSLDYCMSALDATIPVSSASVVIALSLSSIETARIIKPSLSTATAKLGVPSAPQAGAQSILSAASRLRCLQFG